MLLLFVICSILKYETAKNKIKSTKKSKLLLIYYLSSRTKKVREREREKKTGVKIEKLFTTFFVFYFLNKREKNCSIILIILIS